MTRAEFGFSESERHGLELLSEDDLLVYSVGISTGGVAEMEIVRRNPRRKVIATTLDQAGADFAIQTISEAGIGGSIEVKIEDVSLQPLPYLDDYFDYIYARLVLHYLPKQELDLALLELKRITIPNKKLYVVVRSTDCFDTKREGTTYDGETELTTYTQLNFRTGKPITNSRYFHTKDSISQHATNAGWVVDEVRQHDEQLFKDFKRTQITEYQDNLIELLAHKP